MADEIGRREFGGDSKPGAHQSPANDGSVTQEGFMNNRGLCRAMLCLALSMSALLWSCGGTVEITSPEKEFGHPVGADYKLLNYTQFTDYLNKLDQESDRLTVTEIGKTAEGRSMVMGIITSPENHRRLERYQEIARRLALAEELTDDEARALAAEGKAVVWIDGGTHSSEIVNHQTEFELVYQMVSGQDAETKRFLDDVILLALVTNPDGMELVANWYMEDPQTRNPWQLPELFHKYIGGDTNRDHFMSNMPETENINRVLYRTWFPQIIYNQHQTGPQGTVLFVPPFRDPFNYDFDPLIPAGIDLVGAAIQNRFIRENKPGATSRSGASYSTWWDGCLRCGSYFHNAIGILTEISGSPTPMEISFIPDTQLPRNDLPYPIAPQKWHFRQAVDYIMSANRAILDVASKYREEFLFNIYQMARNSIDKGSRDNWTVQPKRIAAVKSAIEKDGAEMIPIASGGSGRERSYPLKYYEMLRDPSLRDARAYILPADQPDFLTAVKFVNVLIKGGVTVHRASQSFEAGSKTYPAGSFVILASQAYRPYIRSMLEPQDHPNDIPCPGCAPTPPYDAAGWTLAYQMGIRFDRILEGVEGPFEKIEGFAEHPAGAVSGAGTAGYLLSHQVNDSAIAVNRLLEGGEEVFWLRTPSQSAGRTYPAGTIFISPKDSTRPKLEEIAAQTGLEFAAADSMPGGEALRLKPVRIGLWDQYGGSSPSGWTRWLLEQYGFSYQVVYPPELDAGDLNSKYDVLIFVTGGISQPSGSTGRRREQRLPDPQSIPEKYRDRLALVTAEKTLPQLRQFLNQGGTIITIGTSTSLAYQLSLPVADHLTDGATGKPLTADQYYVPGSILQVRVDNTHPLAYGLPELADVFFDESPVFRLKGGQGIRRIAWFDSAAPLRSGWAWGQDRLADGIAIAEADVGKGKLLLFGPEIAFRAQPHGTFKFLFNGIHLSGASQVAGVTP